MYNLQIRNLGGEYSSLSQNSFHHYRDFWCFDITTHTWDRIEAKQAPTARSGHRSMRISFFSSMLYVMLTGPQRMAIWKHFIVLFGGFYDAGITSV
jgi:hypothetical protein